ncbi:MAG: ATP-binding protein [Desulfosudaceae bacterium]
MVSNNRIYLSREADRLLMRFPSDLEYINQAEKETCSFLENAGLAEDIFPVCLVMREAMLNAVKHGNHYDSAKKVTYSLQLNNDILTMEVEDEGPGFDWQSLRPDRPAAESEHGRGLFIMRRYFSDFTFNKTGNKITLTRYCTPREAEETTRQKQLDALTQSILLNPENVKNTPSDDLYRLIENFHVHLNHLALENAELRRAQTWLQTNQSERTAAVNEERYRALFEYNPIETITVDHDCRVTEYNLAKEKAGDRLPEIGSVMYRDYAASHTIDMLSELKNCISTGTPKEFRELPYRNKYLHIRISPFSGGAIITSVNITPLKKAEKDLARLVTAIEQAREEIVVIDLDGRVEYANTAFTTNNNFDRQDIPGLEFFNHERHLYDKTHYEDIWNALDQGLAWTGRFSRPTPSNGFTREIEATISPVRGDSGKTICYVSVSRDITREVRLEEQLRQTQRLKAIGTLAGGIAHDFNNILGSITVNAEMIEADASDSEQSAAAGQILQASRRARDLINQILLFSRHSAGDRQPLRVAVVVKETLKMLRAMLPSTIQISQRISDESAMIMGDPTQIQEVLMNLCNNSAQAMQENGGNLRICLEKATPEELAGCAGMPEGDYVKLSVYDTGHGIAPDIVDRIFDPFFTDRKNGQGTGLGLSVTHGIVANHGGALTVSSVPGRWTEFKAFFPLTKATESLPDQPAASRPPGQDESLLLVDDEKLITRVGEKMLTRLGYRVTTANSGKEALELFMADPHRYDLVITDMTMPYMTGVDLARTLMEIRPDIPIILCTGFNAMVTPEKARKIGIRKFIMKPFESGKMAAAIREVLDHPGDFPTSESDWS